MKTKTLSKKEDSKEHVIIKVDTLQEAKEIIYASLQEGKNYKDIAKTKFDINGTLKSFNINQISQIKTEFEPKTEQIRYDADQAEVFRLFYSGKTPAQVIIKTKYSYDFVKESWEQYAVITYQRIVPNRFFRELKKTFSPIVSPGNEDLNVYLSCAREITSYAEEWINCSVNCSRCKEPMEMEEKMLKDAKQYLSKKWHHSKCVN